MQAREAERLCHPTNRTAPLCSAAPGALHPSRCSERHASRQLVGCAGSAVSAATPSGATSGDFSVSVTTIHAGRMGVRTEGDKSRAWVGGRRGCAPRAGELCAAVAQAARISGIFFADGGPDVLISIRVFDSADEALASNEIAASWIRTTFSSLREGCRKSWRRRFGRRWPGRNTRHGERVRRDPLNARVHALHRAGEGAQFMSRSFAADWCLPLGLTQRPERALEMQLAFFGLAHHAGEVATQVHLTRERLDGL